MTEKKKEQKEITENQKKVTERLIKQSEDKINLLLDEKKAKMKIVELKNKYNKLREGTDKPEFLFKQEFYDTLLNIDNINLKHYITQVDDAVDREQSTIKALENQLKDKKVISDE